MMGIQTFHDAMLSEYRRLGTTKGTKLFSTLFREEGWSDISDVPAEQYDSVLGKVKELK